MSPASPIPRLPAWPNSNCTPGDRPETCYNLDSEFLIANGKNSRRSGLTCRAQGLRVSAPVINPTNVNLPSVLSSPNPLYLLHREIRLFTMSIQPSIDDTNTTLITYEGTWELLIGSSRQWDSSVHSTITPGSSATFSFRGK